MASFPALEKRPDVALEQGYNDPALKSEAENGLVFTRPRSASVKRLWTVTYSYATTNDLGLLDSFIRTEVVGGSGSFDWVDPRTGEAVTVRFSKLPSFKDAGYATQKSSSTDEEAPTSGLTYHFSFELTEV